MVIHDFAEKKRQGKKGESFLDRYFSLWYKVEPVSLDEERAHGYDRIFKGLYPAFEYLAKAPVEQMRVEYKTDYLAAKTGNVFIETISVSTAGKKGWIYTSHADLLVYFIPPIFRIYCCPMKDVRKVFLSDWQSRYVAKIVSNGDYATHGILVPVSVFAKTAKRTIQL